MQGRVIKHTFTSYPILTHVTLTDKDPRICRKKIGSNDLSVPQIGSIQPLRHPHLPNFGNQFCGILLKDHWRELLNKL